MEKFSISKIWPYLAAIVVFIIIAIVYFSPVLEGKKLRQSDMVHWKGAAKEINDYREATGEEALWTNSMFSGMPAYQISLRHKDAVIRSIDKALQLGLPHPINLVFLYFLGFFILMLTLRINPWMAVLGSLAFAFSSYFFIILEAGHNTKAHAIGYMAPVLAGIIIAYRGKYLLGAAITALFLSLELLSNHLQITYYLLLIIAIFGIAEFITCFRNRKLPHFFKASAVLIFAAMLASGSNISNIWATYEYGKTTIRGKSELTTEKDNRTSGLDIDYVTAWSYGISETLTLLIPDFMGGSSTSNPTESSNSFREIQKVGIPQSQAAGYMQYFSLYWGDQPFTSGPVYVGAIIIFLFVLGIFIVKGVYKWWLLIATILSILLAWGHNFMPFTEFFLHFVPGYNKFRAVSMTLVIAELCIPILAMLALKTLFDKDTNRKDAIKKLGYSLYITGGITLFFAIFPGAFFNFQSASDAQLSAAGFPGNLIQALRDDRQAVLREDAIRSLLFIVAAAGLIWVALLNKIKKEFAFIGLIVFVLADMWTVNKRYLNSDNFEAARKVENPYQPSAANNQILADTDPNFRVLNATLDPFKDASTSYFHKSIGGYHGAKLRRYQELYDHHISRNNDAVLNMLNTKYIIVGDRSAPQARLNPGALGNAWIVDDYHVVANADEEIMALNDFDPENTAIIDQRFEGQLQAYQKGSGSNSSIKLKSYKPNELIYSFKSDKDELVVFSEIYYDKGWNVYIDDEKLPYLRTNYVLRGMIVPKGDHEIIWKFKPMVYTAGGTISIISSVILLLILLMAVFFEVRQKK
jgi:hypothetical protein